MANLAQARQRAFAKARLAALPVAKTTILQEMEAEGREDFAHFGAAAMNPYMGAEGDAWARGYWSAQAEAE